jgi:hypothetical protein
VKYRFEGTQRFWEKRKALAPRQRASQDTIEVIAGSFNASLEAPSGNLT